MTRWTRLLALLAALALIAAACGGGEEDDSATTAETTTTTTTTAPEAVASTEGSDSTTTTSSTTTTVPDLGPRFPLSGEPLPDGELADRAAVVVKVSNNDATARRALNGVDQADLIYEERIEQQATRFAVVFHSELPEEVGSVRSGRTTDIQIVSNLNRPVFAFSGANDGVHSQLRQAENEGLLIRASADFGDSEFSRTSDFRAPNNLVVDTVSLLENAEGGEAPNPVFDYSDNVISLGAPAAGVRVAARIDALFVWSTADDAWLRFQEREPLVTQDGVSLAPENVVVMTTSYVPSAVDANSVDAITVGTGDVMVLSRGFLVEGTWTREFERDPITLQTNDGQTIGLAPGQTWISLTPAGTAVEISKREADTFLE